MTNSFKPTETTIQRILFCTDFSENANFAFNSEAQFWKSYIYEVEGVDAKARHDMDERIDQTYLPRLPEGLELKVEFRIGKDYLEILNFTRENQIDLIVMGRQGHNALQKAFFGNVTEKVVRKADSVVLVVPLSYRERLSGS